MNTQIIKIKSNNINTVLELIYLFKRTVDISIICQPSNIKTIMTQLQDGLRYRNILTVNNVINIYCKDDSTVRVMTDHKKALDKVQITICN